MTSVIKYLYLYILVPDDFVQGAFRRISCYPSMSDVREFWGKYGVVKLPNKKRPNGELM